MQICLYRFYGGEFRVCATNTSGELESFITEEKKRRLSKRAEPPLSVFL